MCFFFVFLYNSFEIEFQSLYSSCFFYTQQFRVAQKLQIEKKKYEQRRKNFTTLQLSLFFYCWSRRILERNEMKANIPERVLQNDMIFVRYFIMQLLGSGREKIHNFPSYSALPSLLSLSCMYVFYSSSWNVIHPSHPIPLVRHFPEIYSIFTRKFTLYMSITEKFKCQVCKSNVVKLYRKY